MITGTLAVPGRRTREQPPTCSHLPAAARPAATYLQRPDLGRRLRPGTALLERLPGWSVAPLVLAAQARVALGDEIGAERALGASGVALKDEGPVLPPGAG